MAQADIRASQRYTRDQPCPICGGHPNLPHGKGVRCVGYLSGDGEYAHCSREEFAQNMRPSNSTPPTYGHRRHGLCACGVTHAPDNRSQPSHPAPPRRPPTEDLGTLVAEYPYYDEQGKLLYKVNRYHPKDFRPFHQERGQWVRGLGNARRVLYRLPELLKASDATIYVVEGEKDVDTLRAKGLVATCNQGGSSQWHMTTEAPEILSGRHVVIIPDRDEPGEKHGIAVAKSLLGKAASVKVVYLPEDSGKDVTDFFTHGGTLAQLVTLVEETITFERIGLRYQLMSDIEVQNMPPLPWLVDRVLPEGALSSVFGESWTGKSFLALDMCMRIALGWPWEGHATSPGRTVYVAAEGKRGLTLRLKAWKIVHGIPLDESIAIHILGEAVPLLEPERVGDLLAALRALPDPPKLVVIDTLGRSLTGGEENSNDDMNAVCNAAALLQRELGTHVMLVHHKSKAGAGPRGGSAFFAGIDTAIEVAKEKTSPIVSVTCEKQKDGAEAFSAVNLKLVPVLIDEEMHLTSCVLQTTAATDVANQFRPTTRTALLMLGDKFPNGATSTEWEKACGMARSTFTDARTPLLEQHLVRLDGYGKGAKYTLTAKGQDRYGLVRRTYENDSTDTSGVHTDEGE